MTRLLGEAFFRSYQECKRIKSPEECRALAAAGADRAVRGLLVSYDKCIEVFGVETCTSIVASEKSRSILVVGIAFTLGFVVGRILK